MANTANKGANREYTVNTQRIRREYAENTQRIHNEYTENTEQKSYNPGVVLCMSLKQ